MSKHAERIEAALRDYEAGDLPVREICSRNGVRGEIYAALKAAKAPLRRGEYEWIGRHCGENSRKPHEQQIPMRPKIEGVATRITYSRDKLPIGATLRGNHVTERIDIGGGIYEYRTRGVVAFS